MDATFNFTVRVADSGSPQQVATRALSILIRTDALTITITSLSGGQVGVAYSQFVSATNGQQPLLLEHLDGRFARGPHPSTATPAKSAASPRRRATFPFTVQVTDDLGDTATAN